MTHYVEGKSVCVEYKIGYETHVEGIGLVETNNKYFSCNKGNPQRKLKEKLGKERYKELEDVISPLHLSDEKGVPLHAVENVYYFIKCINKEESDFPSNDYSVETVANYYRISEEDAQKLIDSKPKKEDVKKFVEAKKPDWDIEAKNALSLISKILSELKNEEKQKNKRKLIKP